MSAEASQTLDQLKAKLRPASVAEIGGFRPPDDPVTSWFLKGVSRPGEGLPQWNGKPMFPLLQVRIDELPFVPPQLEHVSLLVLFHSLESYPFDKPHGEGWLIREYAGIDGLVPLPAVETPYRSFPIRWAKVTDDAPGWEDAWELLDMSAVNADKAASHSFFYDFNRYSVTKFGGYPADIQHGVGVDDFVFQIGSEEKVNWMWADNGIGYFHRSPDGEWRFSCQFY
jgi:hypothetical protein